MGARAAAGWARAAAGWARAAAGWAKASAARWCDIHDHSLQIKAVAAHLASEPQRPFSGDCGLVEVLMTEGNILLVGRTAVVG